MNQEVIEKKSLIDLLKANSKLITIFLIIVILGLSLFIWINHNNKNEKKLISENYIQAKIFLEKENNNEAKEILIKLIKKKDEVYSPLSLFLIIDKKLEEDNQKISNLFDSIIKMKNLENEDKNLIILKKAIFISNEGNEVEVLNLLKPIINSDSAWKIECLKFLGDFYYSRKEFKKAKEYYSILINLDNSNFDTSDIERKIKIINNG